jgi:hypothetical protein
MMMTKLLLMVIIQDYLLEKQYFSQFPAQYILGNIL